LSRALSCWGLADGRKSLLAATEFSTRLAAAAAGEKNINGQQRKLSSLLARAFASIILRPAHSATKEKPS